MHFRICVKTVITVHNAQYVGLYIACVRVYVLTTRIYVMCLESVHDFHIQEPLIARNFITLCTISIQQRIPINANIQ